MPSTIDFDTLDAFDLPSDELEAILATPEYAAWRDATLAEAAAGPTGVGRWDDECPW